MPSSVEYIGWGSGAWGQGESDTEALRIWSQQNFGEDLIFAHRNGAMYYWDASAASGDLATRAVELTSLAGASNVPTVVNSEGWDADNYELPTIPVNV